MVVKKILTSDLSLFLLCSVQNDKMKLLKPGSLQHNGDNMLDFLLHSAASPNFLKNVKEQKKENTEQNKAVFFDILVIKFTSSVSANDCACVIKSLSLA
jgi:hypothetical protein